MTRSVQIALHENCSVSKEGFAFGNTACERIFEVRVPCDYSHSSSSSTVSSLFFVIHAIFRGNLDDHRVAILSYKSSSFIESGDWAIGSRYHRHSTRYGNLTCSSLVSHGSQRIALGSNKGDPVFFAQRGKLSVLRQESITRVNGLNILSRVSVLLTINANMFGQLHYFFIG